MNIAIYCGSNFGARKEYETKALELVNFLSKKNVSLVYGGSKAGIMGVISNEAIKLNMNITGVITYDLAIKERENKKLKKIIKVDTIRERKAKMEELANAFITFPGGFGTLEEISEILTSIQLGHSKKPCAFYNLFGYYDKLLEFLQNSVKEGFLDKRHLDAIIVSDDINDLYEKITNYQAPKNKWELD